MEASRSLRKSAFLIGIAYLRKCPMEPKIPLYLVVGGLTGLYKVLLLFFDESKMRHDDYHKPATTPSAAGASVLTRINGRSVATSALHKILDIFLSLWFLMGNFWVLKNVGFWANQATSGKIGDRYEGTLKTAALCETKIYAFALTHLVFCYILLAAAFLYSVVVLLVTRKFRSKCLCTCV